MNTTYIRRNMLHDKMLAVSSNSAIRRAAASDSPSGVLAVVTCLPKQVVAHADCDKSIADDGANEPDVARGAGQ